LQVQDEVAGFARKAVMRWRLKPGHWRLKANADYPRLVEVGNGNLMLTVRASVPIVRCELTEGWESRFYMDKTRVLVLEVEVHEPCMLITELRW
jgi:hypothetical protein